MKKTGELLRAAREKKGISIHEVSMALKVSSRILSAIENGETSQLPARTFLRGFVQSYSQFIKADTVTIMTTFSEEMGAPQVKKLAEKSADTETAPATGELNATATASTTTSSGTSTTKESPAKKDPTIVLASENLKPTERSVFNSRKRRRTQNVVWYGVGIVLVFAVLITKRLVDKYQLESLPTEVQIGTPLPTVPEVVVEVKPSITNNKLFPTGSIPQEVEGIPESILNSLPSETAIAPALTSAPATQKPPTTVTAPPVTSATPASNSTATPAAATLPVTQKPETTQKPAAVAPVATTAPTVTTATATTPSSSTSPAADSPTKPETTQAEVKKNENKKPLHLMIEAKENLSIEFTSADGEKRKFNLEPNQVYTIQDREGAKLQLSNGGAATVFVNGQEQSQTGESGKPLQLNY